MFSTVQYLCVPTASHNSHSKLLLTAQSWINDNNCWNISHRARLNIQRSRGIVRKYKEERNNCTSSEASFPQTPTLLWWILGPHICVSFGSTQAYTLWPRLASTQKDCRMLIPHLDQFWSIGLCDMTAYRIVCHHVETYISHFFLFAGRVCVVTVPALKQTDLIKRLELNQINKQNHTDQSESYTDNSNSVNYFSVLCWSLTLHAVFDKHRIKNHDFLHFLKNNLEWNNWG